MAPSFWLKEGNHNPNRLGISEPPQGVIIMGRWYKQKHGDGRQVPVAHEVERNSRQHAPCSAHIEQEANADE
jgi:hypothetical protein